MCPNNSKNFTLPELPVLADSIPYNKLGSGKIVFQRENNNYEGIYVIDINHKKSWGINQAGFAPQISPGGDKIALTKYTNSETAYDVYLTDIYGNNPKRISNIKGQEECPTWSQDNHKIIYYSYLFSNGDGWIPAYVYDIQSATTSYIMDFAQIDYYIHDPLDIISCSREDICLASLSGKEGICTFGLNGDNFKQIIKYNDEYAYFSPTWNPAGNKIAVMAVKLDSLGSTEMNIILFDQDGSDSTKIFTSKESQSGIWNGNNNYSLCWSPDGSKILFNKRDGNLTAHIYMINADGTNLNTITSIPEVYDRSLSWGE
ncbi:MAG: hypothetical protein P8Z35_05520 [Ignavibacteriaceae bacterium]